MEGRGGGGQGRRAGQSLADSESFGATEGVRRELDGQVRLVVLERNWL